MDFREINGTLVDVDEILYVSDIHRYLGDRRGFYIHFKNNEELHIKTVNTDKIQIVWMDLKKILQEKQSESKDA